MSTVYFSNLDPIINQIKSLQMNTAEHSWVQFGNKQEITDFLNKAVKMDTPRVKKIIKDVIDDIASAYNRRNVVTPTRKHTSEVPELTDALKSRLSAIIKKQSPDVGQSEKDKIVKNVSLGLRVYMDQLPSISPKKEK